MTEKSICSSCKFENLPENVKPCSTCEATRVDNRWTGSEYVPADDAAEIDHPAHYAGKIECIDAMLETMGRDDVRAFCLCSAFKYLWRCKKKHETPTEDVKKAAWYLGKYLELGGDL